MVSDGILVKCCCYMLLVIYIVNTFVILCFSILLDLKHKSKHGDRIQYTRITMAVQAMHISYKVGCKEISNALGQRGITL